MTKLFLTFLMALFFASGLHTISCAGVTAANKTSHSKKQLAETPPSNSIKAKYWIVTAMHKM